MFLALCTLLTPATSSGRVPLDVLKATASAAPPPKPHDEARCWVEVDIEDPRAADVLASALPFTNRSCWGAHNVNARRRRGKPSSLAGAFEEEGESQSQSEDGEQ